MATERTELTRTGAGVERLTTAEVIDRLSRFGGPPEQFLANLLAVQCQIGPAQGGAIIRSGPEGSAELLAVYPGLQPNASLPVWLAQAIELLPEMLSTGVSALKPLHAPDDMYGQPPQRHLALVPLRGPQAVRGMAAFMIETRDELVLAAARDRLELSVSLLSLYEMRLTLQRRQLDLRRLRLSMEVLAAVNEQERFAGIGMALCNELASRWQCDRVSLGFLKGRYVHVRAMSHTEKFSRKMKVVQDIESAMEECVDQDVEVLHPSSPEATYVSRAAAELSRHHGPSAILTLPLRHSGEAKAAILLERPADQPFNIEEIESLRLAADLITPRLVNLEEHDKWIGARMAGGIRKGAAAAVGPKHTWIKLLVILIVGFLLFAFLVDGEYRVEAPFALEPIEQQVVPAPFDGYLSAVYVEPGDMVEGGKTTLATLETAELKLRLASAKAERLSYLKQATAASAEDKTAEAQIYQAQADSIGAQMNYLEYQIAHATVISPMSGLVVTGDLKRQVGAPVKTGDVLFEVAPVEALRAELLVPDSDAADLLEGQAGEIATASYPDQRVAFVVERINPMSEVVERQNVYKVRVRLDTAYPWMRPGMEGLAKVDIGKRSYAWIWTRTLVNWVRMQLWL